jgi:DNA-binding NarL/FixJ family response regulator
MSKKIASANGYLYETLTERELEILFLLADGLRDQEIAQQLHLAAQQTVRWYNSRIYSKLHVNNRVEVVDTRPV